MSFIPLIPFVADKYLCFQIMYFMGFALFVLEALLSIWVFQVGIYSIHTLENIPPTSKTDGFCSANVCFCGLQKVYWFFRGKGSEAQMRPDAASRAPPF